MDALLGAELFDTRKGSQTQASWKSWKAPLNLGALLRGEKREVPPCFHSGCLPLTTVRQYDSTTEGPKGTGLTQRISWGAPHEFLGVHPKNFLGCTPRICWGEPQEFLGVHPENFLGVHPMNFLGAPHEGPGVVGVNSGVGFPGVNSGLGVRGE